MRISHGIVDISLEEDTFMQPIAMDRRGIWTIELPPQFMARIIRNGHFPAEFTYGYTDLKVGEKTKYVLHIISLTHWKDQFVRKLGFQTVKGRLEYYTKVFERTNGDFEATLKELELDRWYVFVENVP
jgi:hypothetical protein